MFSILVGFSLCARMKLVAPNDPKKTAFDLKYADDESEISITGGEGFYVVFKDRDDETNTLQFLHWQKKIVNQRYTISLGEMEDRDTTCKRIHVHIENKDEYRPLNFDLGVFADANFKSDQDTLSIALNRRAFQIQSTNGDNSLVMLIVNGSNYPSVDTLFLNELKDSANIDPTNYPYWKNSLETTTNTQDSVFAFSWQKRTIHAKSEGDFGFIAVPKATYSTEPFVFDKSENLNGKYGRKTQYFEILDYDNDDKLTFTYIENGKSYTSRPIYANPGADKVLKTLSYRIRLTVGKTYRIKAYATDKLGYQSKPIEKMIYAYGAKTPELNVTSTFEDIYNPGEYIYAEGRVNDDIFAFVCYQFEGLSPKCDDGHLTAYGSQLFSMPIPIPNTLTTGQNYKFQIWAEDEYGYKSEITNHTFLYAKPDRPIITSVYLSEDRIIKGSDYQLVIYGEGTDPDKGQIVTLFVQVGDEEPRDVGNFTSTGGIETFAFFYDINPEITKGRHPISFFLMDDHNRKSANTTKLSFLIYDPNDKLPPAEIGQIIDVSSKTIKSGSNALFNLQYIDVDKIPHEMTFNNEGFFAAFRSWTSAGGGEPMQMNIMKYGGSETVVRADNFEVRYQTINDSVTGYKRLQFTVTNRNYFPRLFELSVFADSDFSGDDNSLIQMLKDRNGFVVTNEAKKLHYTVFTRGVYNSPDVSRHYLSSVTRKGTGEIPISDIPFFMSTDWSGIKELRGVNAMYGFSWMKTVNPDEPLQLAVEVAGHDKIKTPPKVVNRSEIPTSINHGDTLNFVFAVADADLGEDIRVNITINGELHSYTFNNNGTEAVYNVSYTVPDDKFSVEVVCIAEDMEEGAKLLSNRFNEYYVVTGAPRIWVDPIKHSYHTQSKIRLSGTFDEDENYVRIKYRWVDGFYRSRENELQWATSSLGNNKFNKTIKIPSDIYPRQQNWGIVVYAFDQWKVKSNEVTQYFKLNPYNPPKMTKAGLSKRITTVGSTVLGYAAIMDEEYDYVDIIVKVGLDKHAPEQRVLRYNNARTAGQRKPVAFYWEVPNVEPGTYDIAIFARDSEELESKRFVHTVIINAK